MKEDSLREMLINHLDEIKKRNPRFSLRSFAQKTNISQGSLSLFMANKRSLSAEAYDKLVSFLIKDPEIRKNALSAYNDKLLEQLKRGTGEDRFREMTREEFSRLKDWHVYALLSLIQTEGFKFDVAWISKRIGISRTKVEETMVELVKHGFVQVNPDNTVTRSVQTVRTPDNTFANDPEFVENINEQHRQLIEQSMDALGKIPRELRDITAVTMPADPENLEKARELIRKFQDDLMLLMEDGKKREVFRLCIQLYPVSK